MTFLDSPDGSISRIAGDESSSGEGSSDSDTPNQTAQSSGSGHDTGASKDDLQDTQANLASSSVEGGDETLSASADSGHDTRASVANLQDTQATSASLSVEGEGDTLSTSSDSNDKMASSPTLDSNTGQMTETNTEIQSGIGASVSPSQRQASPPWNLHDPLEGSATVKVDGKRRSTRLG